MSTGTVESFNVKKRYGYIAPRERNDRIPFEAKDVIGLNKDEAMKVGEWVDYRVEGGLAGLLAKQVRRR